MDQIMLQMRRNNQITTGQLATGGLQPAKPSMHIDEASVNEIN